MKHNQYAKIKVKNDVSMYVNTDYITVYGYLKDDDKTVVSILGEQNSVYFPGDQTGEIENAINRIDA